MIGLKTAEFPFCPRWLNSDDSARKEHLYDTVEPDRRRERSVPCIRAFWLSRAFFEVLHTEPVTRKVSALSLER
jgi:hypothetical protein